MSLLTNLLNEVLFWSFALFASSAVIGVVGIVWMEHRRGRLYRMR